MTKTNAQAQIDLHKELAPRYAYRYGFEFSRLFQQDWHAEMISHVPSGATRVLDLGCGTGFFLAELEDKHPGAVGLDISHDMLKVSDRYVPGARLVTADAERLPFAPGRFDAVFCKNAHSMAERAQPEPVGSYPTDCSPYGVHDMPGGIREWCDSWFDESNGHRLVRGGSWNFGEIGAHCAYRLGCGPTISYVFIGFRLVHDFE